MRPMGGQDPPSAAPSADHRRWKRLFRALVEMLRSQQSQIESLAGDRTFMEDYIQLQHDSWAARAHLLQSHIAQMRKEEEKRRRVQAAMLDLAVGMKQREALCYKKQCEITEGDLEDFSECMEALCTEISVLKGKLDDKKSKETGKGKIKDGDLRTIENAREEEHCAAAFEGEIRRLRHAYKKLSSRKDTEVSALLAEKDFVWNQFKKMESDYTAILKTKRIEVDQAKEATEKLQLNLERLQTSENEKDQTIAKLEAERTRLELDRRRCNQEAEKAKEKLEELQIKLEQLQTSAKEKDEMITRLRSDLAKLDMDAKRSTSGNYRLPTTSMSERKLRNASVTPEGSHPRRVSGKRSAESANGHQNQKRVRVDEDSYGSRPSNMRLQRCSRTHESRSMSTLESPRLFSANFKVPKLKDLSPAAVL